MNIQLNTSKHLSESTWKSMAAKHKVKDNGLSRALSDCAKQVENDEYDLVLKSLAQVTVLVGKLKAEKSHAANRDVCHYLENVTKEVAKLRVEVAAEKKDCAESEAEDAKEEADEVKLAKSIGVELAAGLQKAKKTECGVLICVASPVYGLMVAARLSTQHKTKLTDLTGCKQFLPMGYCIWDDDKRAYYFLMQRKDTGLAQPLQDAIKYFASMSVKIIITTRAEYDKLKKVQEESYTDEKEEKEEKEEKPYESEDGGGGEDLQDARRPIEPEDEPKLTGVRPFDISGSVGQGGKNAEDDVQQVQTALNRKGASLNVDGKIGSRTIQAIRDFQKKIGIAYPDGLVEVGKRTATALAGNGSAAQYAGNNSGGSYGGGSNGGGYGDNKGGNSYGGNKGGSSYGGNKGGSSYGGGNQGGGAYGGGSNGGGTYGGGSSGNYGGNSGGNYGGSKGGSTYGGGQYSGGGNTGYGGSGADYGYSGSSGGAAGAASGGGNQSGGKVVEQSGAAQPQEGFLEHAGNAAGNVYEQRKEQAKGVVDSIEEALLPDHPEIGEGPIKDG
ncbi:MAG TPA: peptidoglycan-binding domain-containing protein [Planctomycetota bacterium]|nr:peptidoglycan-binding domain-containing protein [Planctomycetota bacterium]